MFKHPYCGGQHETVTQARECQNGTPATVSAAPVSAPAEDVWPWATPAKPARSTQVRFEDRNRTKGDLKKTNNVTPLGYAYAKALKAGTAPAPVAEPEFIAPPSAPQNHFQAAIASEWDASPAPVQTPACSGRNSGFRGYPATEAQMKFITSLLEERDWEHAISPDSGNGEAISLIGNGAAINKQEASSLISTLLELPKAQDLSAPVPAGHKEQPWKTLSKEVPAGNYCVEVDGKNHFYRVSVSDKGFFKVQERASETLHFVPLKRYAGILQSILDRGLEASRLAYSTEMGRCWKCGLKLTDNTGNPYFSQGLGPDCGAQ